ncbi:MAG: flagellar biosynthetic protein FliR [Ruminococcaceae bacterium]|jgi:flagellar biosynthetic protein FliR|nr:flagellar biosynthetic protein FliR [Oscillospiraceae bacterium]
MFNWTSFTLLLFIIMRMTGFVLFSPIFGRNGLPRMFQAGFILMLSWMTYSVYGDAAIRVPDTILELGLRLVLELGLGLVFGVVMRFFFYIPEQAGELVDMQMGMSMARTYDPTTQTQTTTTANLLSIMAMLLFFAANGHITLLRIMLTSGEIVPFGQAAFGKAIAERVVELFAECVILAIKLGLPILAAELMGQIGMGVLMKAIPQINVFSINIELKMLIGLFMLLFLIAPMGDFLLEAEGKMLEELSGLLTLAAP